MMVEETVWVDKKCKPFWHQLGRVNDGRWAHWDAAQNYRLVRSVKSECLFHSLPLVHVLAVSKQKASAQTRVTLTKMKYWLVIVGGLRIVNSTARDRTAKME